MSALEMVREAIEVLDAELATGVTDTEALSAYTARAVSTAKAILRWKHWNATGRKVFWSSTVKIEGLRRLEEDARAIPTHLLPMAISKKLGVSYRHAETVYAIKHLNLLDEAAPARDTKSPDLDGRLQKIEKTLELLTQNLAAPVTENVQDDDGPAESDLVEDVKPVSIFMIPDVQSAPESPKEHLRWAGKVIAEKRPDIIVQIGDFADMKSLCSYDKGTILAENQRYLADIKAATEAMDALTSEFRDIPDYKPKMFLTLGNHEQRIETLVKENPILEGKISLDDLPYKRFGFTVIPFLEQLEINRVYFAHYFHPENSPRAYSSMNPQLILNKVGESNVSGHLQSVLLGFRFLPNGKRQRVVRCGSFYTHYEGYRGAQSTSEWRGCIFMDNVFDGDFDIHEISIDTMCRKYEGMPIWKFLEKHYNKIFQKSEWLQRMKKAEIRQRMLSFAEKNMPNL